MDIHIFKLFWALLCGVIFAPAPAGSFPYQPSEIIQIVSESATGFTEGRKADVYTWRVVPETGQTGGTKTLSFFRAMSDNRLCRLVLSEAGVILDADIEGVSSNMMIRKDDLLLIPGFPVPCDILPFQLMAGDHPSASRLYQINRSAGTQTFVDTLEVSTYPVTYKSAQSSGWIKNTQNVAPTDLLQVLKVVNPRTGDVLSVQLWVSNADWWIYEKTRLRQSWRLP